MTYNPTLFEHLQVPEVRLVSLNGAAEVRSYEACRACVEELALYLRPLSAAKGLCVHVHVQSPRVPKRDSAAS